MAGVQNTSGDTTSGFCVAHPSMGLFCLSRILSFPRQGCYARALGWNSAPRHLHVLYNFYRALGHSGTRARGYPTRERTWSHRPTTSIRISQGCLSTRVALSVFHVRMRRFVTVRGVAGVVVVAKYHLDWVENRERLF